METTVEMATPASKTTVGLRRVKVKKKINLNTSKTKLKSVPATPVNFSFHNMSIQKQTLRANNKALAQSLAKVKLELRQVNSQNMELLSQNQDMQLELMRLKRVAGLKDNEIDNEVQLRVQIHMKEIKQLVEEATRNMMNTSESITNIYDKCIMFCRRSTSSRPASLINDSNLSLLNLSSSSHRRTLTTSRPSHPLPHTECPLKADEIAIHSLSDLVTRAEPHADMSAILEQSVLTEDTTEQPMIPTLTAVSETSNTPKSNSSESGRTSKLPQRVARQTSRNNLLSGTGVAHETKNPQNSDQIGGDLSKVEQKTGSKSKSKKRNINSEKIEENDIEKKKSCLTKELNANTSKTADNSKSRTRNKSKENKSDSKAKTVDSDSDKSSFSSGFGEMFDNLVSGSPITASAETNSRRETFTLAEPPVVEPEYRTTEKESESIVEASDVQTSSENSHTKKPVTGQKFTKSNSKSTSKLNEKSKSMKDKPVVRRDTYASINPFKPKATLKRTPETSSVSGKISSQKTGDKLTSSYPIEEVDNPFKPTKNLLRSPVAKLDSRQFLAKLCNNLDSREVESEPLPEPSFIDEPTTYFNSDMEFTTVIDSARLLEALSASDRRSPFTNSIENIAESTKALPGLNQANNDHVNDSENMVNNTEADIVDGRCEIRGKNDSKHKARNHKPETVVTHKKDKHNIDEVNSKVGEKEESKENTVYNEKEKAMVEMRIDKPGNFTFAASRKEADGSRKPVPEKVSSRARSKKKKLTPEKDREPKSDMDKDVFNFGDRTPTVPLNKILQEKASSVYDLSMNESLAAPPVSLSNFRETVKGNNKLKENTEKESDANSHIYHLPLKGSPQERPAQRRGRSKSGTRSKSKSRKTNESDDKDYIPAKQRSKSKSRKVNDEDDGDYMPQSSRSKSTRGRSRTRRTADADDEGKREDRLKPQSYQSCKSESATENESNHHETGKKSLGRRLSESPVVVRRSTRCRSRTRPIIFSDDLEDSAISTGFNNDPVEHENSTENTDTNTERSKVDQRKCKSRHVSSEKGTTVKETKSDLLGNTIDISEPSDRKCKGQAGMCESAVEKEDEGQTTLSSETSEKTDTSKQKESLHLKDTEPSKIYNLPLKGSPQDSNVKRMTRSKSRTRHTSESEGEEFDVKRRSSRSRSKSRRRQVPTEEVLKLSNLETEEQEKTSKQSLKSVTNIKAISIEDSDSDFQNEIQHRRKSKRHANTEKNCYDEVETESESLDEHVSNHIPVEAVKFDNQIPEDRNTESDSDKSSAFKFVNKSRGRSLKMNSENTKDGNSDDKHTVRDEKGEKENETADKTNLSTKTPSVKNTKTLSVKTQKSKSVKKKLKDSEKDIERSEKVARKGHSSKETEVETPRSGKERAAPEDGSGAEKRILTDHVDDNCETSGKSTAKKERLPTKTPMLSEDSTTARSSKSTKTKTSKSTRKKRTEDVATEDQTPKLKTSAKDLKISQKKAEKENDDSNSKLANLKRRLTMLSSRMASTDGSSSNAGTVDSSEDQNGGEAACEGEDDVEHKRARRTKNPISYAAIPLNKKLRQGDNMFKLKSPISKAKAEKARLILGQRKMILNESITE